MCLLRSIKLRKLLAALDTLRGEAAAFLPVLPAAEWRDGALERPLEVSRA